MTPAVPPDRAEGLAKTVRPRPTSGRRPRRPEPKSLAADRRAVARLLADRGPIHGDAAAAALGWTRDRWWAAVAGFGHWFLVTGKGWVVTPAGRSAADPGPGGGAS